MPKGINKHGSNELAKAYVHGRLDEARDVGIAKLEKRLTKKLFLWANNIGIHPLELKSLMGTLSVSTEGNHLSGAGMQLSTSGSGQHNSGATMEGAGLPYVGGSRGDDGRSHGSSPDAPSQVALPAPKRRGVAAWVNRDGSPMTPQQRKAESRRRMLKRNDPMAKAILGGIPQKGHGKNTPTKQAKQPLDRKAIDAQRHRDYRAKLKAAAAAAPRNHGKRDTVKQKIYQARHNARKAGLSLPPLPSPADAVTVGRNGHRYPVRTPEEKAARHALHVARHEAKKKGLPLPPLPGDTPAPEINVN